MSETKRRVTIYGLVDPRTGQVRYIGATRKGIEQRCRQHITTALVGDNGGGRKVEWIQELADLGLHPEIQALREVPSYEGHHAERAAIQKYLAMGVDLLNGTSLIPAGSPLPKTPRLRVVTGKVDPSVYSHLGWQAYRAGVPLIDYVGQVLTDFITSCNGQLS